MKKRLLSMLMAVLMIASLVPATALAAGTSDKCAADKQVKGHDIVTVSIDKNAAAKQPGVDVVICNTEKEVVKDVVTPFAEAKDVVKCAAIGHEWKTVELQKATCDVMGVTLTYCANCGTEKSVARDKTSIGAHDYEFTVEVKPTCTKDGWGYAVCKNCKDIQFVANAEGALAILPKDTANTVKLAVEAKFAQTNTDKHDYTDLPEVTEKTVVQDSKGNDVVLMPKTDPTHSETVSGKAVVKADGKVDVVELNANDNNRYNWVKKMSTGTDQSRSVDVYGVKNQINANDKTVYHGLGYTAAYLCPDCGYYVESKTVTGLNDTNANPKHVMTLKSLGYYPYVDKTGTRHDGVTDLWYCDVCGYLGGETLAYADYVDYNEYAVKGDTKVIGAKEADCQNVGATGTKYLFNGENWVVIDKSEEVEVEHHFVPATGKDATCTKDGFSYDNYYVCDNVLLNGKVCGEGKGDATQITKKVAGHTAAVKVLVAPTCSSDGMSVKYCSVCNEYLTKTVNGKEVADYYIVKAVPHTAGDPINVKEATCTEEGYTGDTYCKWCNTAMTKGEVIPMAEHKWVEVEAVAPTCGKDGTTAGKKCSVCDKTEGIEVDPATGKHDYKVENAKDATCTEAGYTGDKTCTVCGDVVKGEVIPMAEHKYVNGVCEVCKAKKEGYNPFNDLKEGDSFYTDILWAWQNNIVDGNDKGGYDAAGTLTRAQVVQMLWNANGKPEAKAAANFSDVAADAWYAKAVAWAVEAGFISGYGDGKFGPTDTCTRAQFVKMLWVINGSPKADAADFSDVAADAWYAQAVAWAAKNEITLGDGAGKFLPDEGCTRGQAAAFLHRTPSLVVKTAE